MTSIEYRKQYLREIEDLMSLGSGYTDFYVNCIMTVSERRYILYRLNERAKEKNKNPDATLSSDNITTEALNKSKRLYTGVTTYNQNG
jgi:hypothetical protein